MQVFGGPQKVYNENWKRYKTIDTYASLLMGSEHERQ